MSAMRQWTRRGVLGMAAGLAATAAKRAICLPQAAPSAPILPLQSQTRELATNWMERYRLPGVWCALIKDGKLQGCVAIGYRDLDHKLPADVRNHLNVGSFSKVITGTLEALIVAKGSISYRTTVREAFPDLAEKYPNSLLLGATLSQLTTHTAGLQNGNGAPFDNHTGPAYRYETLVNALRDPNQGRPGRKSSYCNEDPVIAVAMIERLTGTTYESWLSGELGKSIGIQAPHQVNTDIDEVLTYYFENGGFAPGVRADGKKRAFAPQGACSLTLADICSFLVKTINNGVPLPKNVWLRTIQIPDPSVENARATDAGWLVTTEDGDQASLWHNGVTTRGEYFEAWINIPKKTGFVFYTNCLDRDNSLSSIQGIVDDLHRLSLQL